MKSLIFDAGPVISLTTNNLLWALDRLKAEFDGNFYITGAVYDELVTKPLQSRKFKFEALQVGYRVNKGILERIENAKVDILANELSNLANHIFKVGGNWIKIVHRAEMEVLAAAVVLNASAVVIDERTAKLLIENPVRLERILEEKFESKVFVDVKTLDRLKGWLKNIRVIRSAELILIAFEKGLLDKYGSGDAKTLLEAVLWGVKIHGCAITRREIDRLVELEQDFSGRKPRVLEETMEG